MKKTFIILCVLFVGIVTAQENIHNKNKNTLVEFSEITEYYNKVNSFQEIKADISTYAGTYGYLTIIESDGEIRQISDFKLNWLNLIFKSIGIPKKASDLFKDEVLIRTNNKKYWLPIQKELMSYWKEEIKPKTKTLIYLRAFGSTNDIDENKWLFTINSFNSNYYDSLWDEALNSFNGNDSTNGLSCINKLIELNPKDGRNFSMLGYYYYDKAYPLNIELLKKADTYYSKAIELTPNYSYVYYQKALVKMQLSEYSKAWDNIEISRKLGEQNIEKSKIEELENLLPYSDYKKLKN